MFSTLNGTTSFLNSGKYTKELTDWTWHSTSVHWKVVVPLEKLTDNPNSAISYQRLNDRLNVLKSLVYLAGNVKILLMKIT